MVGSETRMTFGELFYGSLAVMRRNVVLFAIFGLAMGLVAPTIGLLVGGGLSKLVVLPINIGAGYLLLLRILRNEGFVSGLPGSGNFGGYLGTAILTGLGVLGGLLLLILPGLIFLARWSIALPISVTDNRNPVDAITQSWHATKTSQWSILGFFLSAFLLVVMAGVIIGAMIGWILISLYGVSGLQSGPGMIILAYLSGVLEQTASGFGAAIPVAIMHGLQTNHDGLQEVFG